MGVILNLTRKVLLHRVLPCDEVLGVVLSHPRKVSLHPVLAQTSLEGKVHMCTLASRAYLLVLPTDDPFVTRNDSLALPQDDLCCAALLYKAMEGAKCFFNQAVYLFSKKYFDILCIARHVWVEGCAL